MIRRYHGPLITRSGNVDGGCQQQMSYPPFCVVRLCQKLPFFIKKVVFLTLFEPSLHAREDERFEIVSGQDCSPLKQIWLVGLGQIGRFLEGCNVSRRKAIRKIVGR